MLIHKRFTSKSGIGLVLSLCLCTFAFAETGVDASKVRNSGLLFVMTSPKAFPVKVDGKYIGMSGVKKAAVFNISPGSHKIEIGGPTGQIYKRNTTILKNGKEFICVKFVKKESKRPCPYEIIIGGPAVLAEGKRATYVAVNLSKESPKQNQPLKYKWALFPSNAGQKVVEGLGTFAIRVDTSELGGQILTVEVEVTDGIYDANCRQRSVISTEILKP